MLFIAFIFGLCIGSFSNVLIYRLPRALSPVTPRSFCPHCNASIAFYDNIPLISFLRLKGRCRRCKAPISIRYPLVEFLTGILYAGLLWRWQDLGIWALFLMAATSTLLVISFIDLDTFLIPDILSLGLLAAGLGISFFNPILSTKGGILKFAASAAGAALGFATCWLTALLGEWLFKKEALGGGDIKLVAGVGACTGWLGAFDCLLIGSFLGALYGVTLLCQGKIGKRDPIPFGPFLSLGGIFNFFHLLPFGFPFPN